MELPPEATHPEQRRLNPQPALLCCYAASGQASFQRREASSMFSSRIP